MKNELMIFDGKEVEVFGLNGLVLFNPYHVGECLDLAPGTIRDHMTKMNNKQVIKLVNSDVALTNIRKLNNAGENFLTESGVYKLVFKSRKPDAEAFTDWIADEVLPILRKTGSYKMPKKDKLYTVDVSFKEIVETIPTIAADLHVNEISKLIMYQKLYKSYGVFTDFLPEYAIEGQEKKTATELLKQHSCSLSVQKFNQLLLKEGILEERSRNSSSKGIKRFKALSETGLTYGENLINLANQKETQPYYYVNVFAVLLKRILHKEEKV